ncbi:hypothetical protein S40288_07849 [Stachybotrys chartarum IBT 40288]|nr:hypothetical protein S40288_07849 [Stachybotrys chartarum IBT 40288]
MDKSSSMTEGSSAARQSVTALAGRPQQPGGPDPSAASSSSANDAQSSKHPSPNDSSNNSPMQSRDPSPVRYPRRTTSASRLGGNRSRKNSQQDMSPSRQTRSSFSGSTLPSRNLASTPTPVLLPAVQEPRIEAPTPQKPPLCAEGPRWPVSPRLRSPPPQLNKPVVPSVRRIESEPPSINVQRSTPTPHSPEQQDAAAASSSENELEDLHMRSDTRTPTRGLLETVQEVSLPNSPSPAEAAWLEQVRDKLGNDNHSDTALSDSRGLRSRHVLPAHEGGSDSSHARVEARRPTSVPPPPVTRQSSSLSSKATKPKAEGSTQTMIVETETVPTIPQVALATGGKLESSGGTLKTKPSTETIKPKKEKKRTRKQPTVNPGAASSKADIFEAKIASAVDEADTSDSEETFVYDSNPPDTGDRPGRRFHSRTPSATSMASQADRQNLRSIYGVIDGGSSAHVPKKNMKFVNTFNGSGVDSLTTDEDGKGSGRSAGGSARGTLRQHHHIGRWGRQPGNGHPSLFDNESPFHSASTRPKIGGTANRNSSGPPSPRNHHSARGHLNTKRSAIQMSSNYDVEDSVGADDERTPLMGSARGGRSGRYRRGPHSLRQVESQTFTRRSSYLNRFAACLVLTMMFLLVITGAIGFMFATSQPMTEIEIISISNVVTSQQLLMFDITVQAHNPNIVVVTMDHANLDIFAKSEYSGPESDWWTDKPVHLLDDPINDPPRDPDDDSKPNLLLGRVTEFDSPLTFEGSLFHRGASLSTGEMQLAFPGNGTSEGSERWARILQNEFDLIIKGVVKYSLPLSARIRSATVAGRTLVKPNSANDPSLQPNTTLPGMD